MRMSSFCEAYMGTNEPVMIDELFGELAIAADSKKWRVVYTKPKREKQLAKFAANNGISYYLPLVESVRTYKDRKVTFTKPLFSGYLFVCCDMVQRQRLIVSGHTVTFLRVQNEQELVDELKQIYRSKNISAELEVGEYFEQGTRVIITSGPFEGLTGVVKNQNNVTQVMLRVKILHQAVAISVKSGQIEILDNEIIED